jgi:hypothetical protein
MEKFLQKEHVTDAALPEALNVAVNAWSIGRMATPDTKELPDRDVIAKHRDEQLANASLEAAVLERDNKSAIRYRTLPDEELRSMLKK